VTLEAAIYGPFLQYAERSDLRERLYRARAVRAASGPFDNSAILAEILSLRREQAALLFPLHEDYALLNTPTHRFFLTHGDRWNPSRLPPAGLGDILSGVTSVYSFYNRLPKETVKHITIHPCFGHSNPGSEPGNRAIGEALKMEDTLK
jgi:hypothetical protein